MILKLLRDDTRGGSLVEFTVTVPFFLLLMFGLIQVGLLLYTKAGLQHGVEQATRCASVNYSAYRLGPPVSTTASCFGVAPTTVCGSTTTPPPPCDSDTATPYIKDYALQNSFGSWGVLVPPISQFNVTSPTGSCPANMAYVVTASAPYNLIGYIFSVRLTATSTFSITCS
jgi:TadE-like protein